MNFGKLIICSNHEQISYFARMNPQQKTRVIVLDDEPINIEGYIQASILLPLPSMLFRIVDYNDYAGFDALYRDYLRDRNVRSFIYLIVMSLYRGINIVLFCNTSDPSMFMNTLVSVFQTEILVYPLMFEYLPQFPLYCALNISRLDEILRNLVEYGYMSVDEYNKTIASSNTTGMTKLSPREVN